MVFKLSSQAPRGSTKALRGHKQRWEKSQSRQGLAPTKAVPFDLVHDWDSVTDIVVHSMFLPPFTHLNRTLALFGAWQYMWLTSELRIVK